jgi:hypothetical protein
MDTITLEEFKNKSSELGYHNFIYKLNITVTPNNPQYEPYTKTFMNGEYWTTKNGRNIPPVDFCKWLIKQGNKVECELETYKIDRKEVLEL